MGVAMFVALLLAISADTYFTLHDHEALVKTTRESALTRVTTVTQRCELTEHILRVLDREAPAEANWFQGSYEGCERQLLKVQGIAANAP